jgi:hypothetical protein
VDQLPIQAHPFIPVIQLSSGAETRGEGIDATLNQESDPFENASEVLNLLVQAISGEYVPCMLEKGLTAFQLSRGRLGISL